MRRILKVARSCISQKLQYNYSAQAAILLEADIIEILLKRNK